MDQLWERLIFFDLTESSEHTRHDMFQFWLTFKRNKIRGNFNRRKAAKWREKTILYYCKTKFSFKMLSITPNFQWQQNLNFWFWDGMRMATIKMRTEGSSGKQCCSQRCVWLCAAFRVTLQCSCTSFCLCAAEYRLKTWSRATSGMSEAALWDQGNYVDKSNWKTELGIV